MSSVREILTRGSSGWSVSSTIVGLRSSTRPSAAVDQARKSIANQLHASAKEIVFTSGATESNNLALFGLCERKKRRGNARG